MQHAERLSVCVISAVVVLTPLLFNPYSRRVFEPEKAVMLRALLVLCVAGWIAHALSRRRVAALSARRRPADDGPAQAILWPTSLLALIFLAATAGSVSLRVSWIGSYEWRQGAVTFLACLALFGAAAVSFRTTAGLTRLAHLAELTSVIVAAYGILQYFGWNLLTWNRSVEGRAFSSLGHPNFLAAYLVLVIPVAAARLAASSTRRVRGLHLAVLALDGACLLLTFSRSGWLGLLAGGACYAGLATRWGAPGGLARREWWAAGLVAAALALFAVAAYLDPHGWFSYSPLEPIHSFLRGKSATAQVRALVWDGALQAIRARPWLGYGPETFRLSFPPAYPPALSIYGGVTAAGGHAHNEWLDWTLSTGLLGLAAYLWLLFAVFRQAVRSLSHIADPAARWLQIGLIAGAAGYLAQNQLSFGTIAPLAHFWLFLGLTVAVAQGAGPNAHPKRPDFRSLKNFGSLAAVAFVAIAAYFVLWPDVKSLAADVPAAEAQRASEIGNWPAAVEQYDRAIRLVPNQDHYLAWQAEAYTALATQQGTPAAFARGEADLRRALELSPGDAAYWTTLGALYYDWGAAARDTARLDAAVEAYRRAAALSPTDPDIDARWGRVYHALKQYEAALAKYREALALDPLHVQAYTYMGEAYLAVGQLGAARETYDKVDEVTATIDRLVSKR